MLVLHDSKLAGNGKFVKLGPQIKSYGKEPKFTFARLLKLATLARQYADGVGLGVGDGVGLGVGVGAGVELLPLLHATIPNPARIDNKRRFLVLI